MSIKSLHNGHRIFLMAFFSLFVLSSCSKSQADTLNAEFGEDVNYFNALHSIDNEDEKNAIRQFSAARKKGSYYVAKHSAQALTQLGTLQQKIDACIYLAKNFKDSDSLYIACSNLENENQFSTIISLTSNIDVKNTPDSIIQIRLNALYELNDDHFESEFFNWLVTKNSSYNQYEIYQKYLAYKEKQYYEQLEQNRLELQRNKRKSLEELKYAPLSYQEQDVQEQNVQEQKNAPLEEMQSLEIPQMVLSDEQKLINFRMDVFTKDYKITLENADEILNICKENNWNYLLVYSDLGKAHLYGTSDFRLSAQKFDKYALTFDDSAKYYAHFYAARLYSKTGRYQSSAILRFKNAIDCAKDENQYDNALWYLLDNQSRGDISAIIETLKKYGKNIKNPSYFDDFFEALSVILLRNQKWQDFYEIWKVIEPYASDEVYGRYAYISGRLLEEGLAKGEEGLATRQAVEAFSSILYKKSSVYYKSCAIERLNIIDDDFVKNILCFNGKQTEEESDEDAEKLLYGYCAFGFPQKVYSEWNVYKNKISSKCAIKCALYLQSCGYYNNDYNVQSLRIASRTLLNLNGKLSDELLHLTYPKYFEKLIHDAAEEFGVVEEVLYSLVRSESFFDAKITSSVGAAGLTQLMSGTANDEAKKLKLKEYDINNPQDNIRMGAHYLSNLIERAEQKSYLIALFGYNAGPKKVKSWISMAKTDWATTGKHFHKITGISMDLFLETVPFEETREYGRKLISSTVMYNYLYKNIQPTQTIRFFLEN